jgi:hypothetical protein
VDRCKPRPVGTHDVRDVEAPGLRRARHRLPSPPLRQQVERTRRFPHELLRDACIPHR